MIAGDENDYSQDTFMDTDFPDRLQDHDRYHPEVRAFPCAGLHKLFPGFKSQGMDAAAC